MSKVGMRHLPRTHGGLAFGKAHSHPLHHLSGLLMSYSYGGFYGEADAAANGATNGANGANGAAQKKGLIAKLTEGETNILGYAVPTIALTIAAGYYLFFSKMLHSKGLQPK